MTTNAPELTTVGEDLTRAVQQWVDQSTTAWEDWMRAWTPVAQAGARAMGMPGRARDPRRSRHLNHSSSCGCGCREHPASRRDHDRGDCGCHAARGAGCRDACGCCVPTADIVVRARVGEVRVVPFRLHNRWRREREVTLDVGPWHVCDADDLEVSARMEESSILLAPCEDRVVRLLLTTEVTPSSGGDDTGEAGSSRAGTPSTAQTDEPPAAGCDLPRCGSAYADVRFEGCGRPMRVALVVSPATCDPVEVSGDCGCCCGEG